jgi:hypothetical protein
MDATRTYSAPGKSFSPDSFGGARERRVLVKECSRRRVEVRAAFTRSSALVAWL